MAHPPSRCFADYTLLEAVTKASQLMTALVNTCYTDCTSLCFILLENTYSETKLHL